ncbi:WD40/YVTN/BNR-like repeat-containing protein [Afifella pfennigii]|uniref:WD40/YVTN/BNR-like repeat-containing protein n=1 Tax=Afifella pfennigii TaxID=209897 RepID=UPI000479FD28|nr:glycoside hydrolase [Afifella pfennigii]
MTGIVLLIGTTKGVFILTSDAARRDFALKGPFCEAWPINHVVGDAASGTIYAGGGHAWVGLDGWKSADLGQSWTRSGDGLAFDDGEGEREDEEAIQSVWSLCPANGSLYAGVKPAGLFRSADDGESWQHVTGLRAHPTRPQWAPGGAGLTLHSIVVDPADDARIWVGISTAGVFHSADGGRNWEPRNQGTRADYLPQEQRYPAFGQCVHNLAKAPGKGERLYQQNHCGMYRSEDGGRAWESIEQGLPSSFGFPVATHPRDPDTVFFVPLNGDIAGRYVPEGAAAVWRSRDAGRSWQAMRNGLPQSHVYFAVLRQAMATDALDPAGVYFGTNTGSLYASADEGESWQRLAEHLPTILSVETMTLAD